MALRLGAQSLGFARLLSNIIRSGSVGVGGLGWQNPNVEGPDVGGARLASPNGLAVNVAVSPASGSLTGRKHATSAPTRLSTFAAGSASGSRRTAGSAAIDLEREGVTTLLAQNLDFVNENLNSQPARRPATEERFVRTILLQAIREWPPNVNLNAKLLNGEIDGRPIYDSTLKAVLYELARPSAVASWDRYKVDNNAEDVFADEEEGMCTPEDARRALNLYKWRLNKASGDRVTSAPKALLVPLLKALSQAELHAELRLVWEKHKALAEHTDDLLPEFLGAFFHAGLFDDVIETFREARASGWPVHETAASLVVRTLCVKGCHRDEIWSFYKGWIEGTKLELDQRQAICDLLESGVTVEDILSLEYTDKVRVRNRLIQALGTLGRKDEAGAIVRTFLKQPTYLDRMRYYALLSLLRTFIRSGFVAEAQQLANAQGKLGVRLDDVLIYALRRQVRFQSGYEAYKALQALEGLHKQSLEVQSLLISNVYAKFGMTEAIYQAYLLGKQLQGDFDANIFSIVIHHIGQAKKDWSKQAEGVLVDYFEARKRNSRVGRLTDYAFQCMGDMYLRANQPDKLASMVKELVSLNLYVNDRLARYWIWALKSQDCVAEAEVVKAAEEEMSKRRYEARLKDRYRTPAMA